MSIVPTTSIWMDGELVGFSDATVHVLSHSLHYGSGAFEGIRAYPTSRGPAIFRLHDHVRRLVESCRILRIDVPYGIEELAEACREVVRTNDDGQGLYVRPIVYRALGEMGVNPAASPVSVAVAAWPWGAFLGDDALAAGVSLKVSTWRRHDPNSVPTAAKSTGSYVNSGLAQMEAVRAGYEEAVMLGPDGTVAEAPGENLFIVRAGAVITPPTSASGALPGITRDSVLTIASELGHEVREQVLVRTDLYLADEVFLTGTAVEVTPVRSVDDRTVGAGARGPVTEAIQAMYLAAVRGELPRFHAWLDWP